MRKQASTDKSLLTDKERLFIAYYMQTFNATKSVKLAGFVTKWPDRYAYELLRKPAIKRMISKTRESLFYNLEKAPIVSFEKAVESIKAIADNAKEDRDKLAAWREINAMLGYLAPSKSIHASVALDLDKVTELTRNLLGNPQNLIENQTVIEALPTIAINGNDDRLDMLINKDNSEVE